MQVSLANGKFCGCYLLCNHSAPPDDVDASCISECLHLKNLRPHLGLNRCLCEARARIICHRSGAEDAVSPRRWLFSRFLMSPLHAFVCPVIAHPQTDAEVWERSISNYPTPSLFSLDLVLHSISKRWGRYFILGDSDHYLVGPRRSLVGPVNNVCKTSSRTQSEPGRNSLATAGINFTKPRTSIIAGPSTSLAHSSR